MPLLFDQEIRNRCLYIVKVVLIVLHTGVTQNVLAIVSNSLVLAMPPIIKVHDCLVRYHIDAYETQHIL